MKQKELQALYQSLDQYEINILRNRMDDFERTENIRFTNLQAYINHLAIEVRERQYKGEFVPRNMMEAQAGYYLV